MASTIYLLAFIIIFCYAPLVSAFATQQFQDWYPEWKDIFQRILSENCTEQYEYWLSGRRNLTQYNLFDRWAGAYWQSALAQPIASCILSNTSDWIKSEMASAAVLLGLTPSILAYLGSSIEESSTLFIIGRRPILVICLAAGSPAVNPVRAFEYTKPLDILKRHKHGLKFPALSTRAHYIITVVEYLLVAGAITNMATVALDLGLKVSYTFAPQRVYLPLLWAYLGSVVHLFGALALKLRVVRSKRSDNHKRLNWLPAQFKPLALQEPERFQVVNESKFYLLVSWAISVGIASHIVFGTVTFSSVLFISVRDSVAIMYRFMASVLVCRMVLTYELAILRDQRKDMSEEEEDDEKLLLPKKSGSED
jgi:hypothetical protein